MGVFIMSLEDKVNEALRLPLGQKRSVFDCYWVEYDDIGGMKSCMNTDIYDDIKRGNPKLPQYKLMRIFGEHICKFCLEGQKVEAMNQRFSDD